MRVEIWSDVVCPWCYIGKRRFEKALAQFPHKDDVQVEWRSFQLNPEHPKGLHQSLEEQLSAKMGAPVEQVRAMNDHVKELAAAEGLDYHFETYTVVNTLDAHRIAHLAKKYGLGSEINERFLRAQLIEGEILDDPETLVRLATEVGVPEAEVRRVLSSDEYTAEVNEDVQTMLAMGGTGVPFFVLDRRYGVSGAQPTELFLRALETAYHESTPASSAH
jgi:predicted DsbA family dithiol-disulfide isomerase